MSTLLYFVPKQISVGFQCTQDKIDAGLTHVEPDMQMQSNWTASGPEGLCGVVGSMCLPDNSDGPPAVYDPAKQVWRKNAKKGYWVGFWKDDLPTPESLARPDAKRLDGNRTKLLDGNYWVIPVCVPAIIRGMGGSTLPRQYDLDDEGNLTGKTRKEYASLADRCYKYFQLWSGMEEYPAEGTPEATELFRSNVDLAAELIGINYRVDRFEAIAVLGLLGSDEYHRVLRAAIDAEGVEAAIEEEAKKASASGDSVISGGEIAGQ